MTERNVTREEHFQFTADIYNSLSSDVLNFIQSKVHNITIAEDILSEVFLGILLHKTGYNPSQGSIKSLLFAIARNKVADFARQSNRRPQEYIEQSHGKITSNQNVEEEIIEKDEKTRLRSAIQTLPTDQQEVLALKFYEGITFNKGSAKLGVPVGTLKSKQRLAFGKIRKALEPLT